MSSHARRLHAIYKDEIIYGEQIRDLEFSPAALIPFGLGTLQGDYFG